MKGHYYSQHAGPLRAELGAAIPRELMRDLHRKEPVRHSPVGVTALSMLFGTLFYLPLAAGELSRVPWDAVSALTWIKVVYSTLFAICVAYTIWYAAVRAIGGARTSVYSNLLPIVAMVTAYLWLGEPIGPEKMAGTVAVLAGVALTRLGQARLQIPAQL